MPKLNNGGIIGKFASPSGLSFSGKWNSIEQSLYKGSGNWPDQQLVFPPSDYYAYWKMNLVNNTISSLGTLQNTVSTNNVTSTTGIYNGSACAFNGTSSYIDLGFNTNFQYEMSWAFWIYPIASGGEVISKISYYAASTNDFPFVVFLSATDINVQISYGGDYSADLVSSVPVNYNQWNHVAITYDINFSSSCKIYHNGTLQTDSFVTSPLSSNSRNWFLGRTSFPYAGGLPGRFFNGYLDEVYLYNRALTDTEVQDFIV